MKIENIRKHLLSGLCIPAHPLALDQDHKFDERHQRALSRYYLAAGAGGLAVAVHTTQFAIRHPSVNLFETVLKIASEEADRANRNVLKIGGICGPTIQAVREAEILHNIGYHAGLLSLAALPEASDDQLIEHAQKVSQIIPLFGFYLQPAVGGRELSYRFWRRFMEIDNVVAIKVAAFNRYQTLDVMRALAESGREDIAMYTGNDDNIVADLLTDWKFGNRQVRFVGGLLGHWAVWTQSAVNLLTECQKRSNTSQLLKTGVEVTDCNAALFDAANHFRGCIAGIHEVLFRQGLLSSTHCLEPTEVLSSGQKAEIDRVCSMYPHLIDDTLIQENLQLWLD